MDLMLGFLLAMSVTMALIPPLMHAAQRFNFLDAPAQRKVHSAPVPRVGGIAMAAGTLLALAMFGESAQPMPAYLAGLVVLLVFGVWDDKVTLSAGPKLVGQILATLLVMIVGDVSIGTITLAERHVLPEWIAAPLTFMFLLGVTNAVNLADGLDGLAGGTTLLALCALALLALTTATPFVGIVAIVIIGAILGFLRFNTHPARVFMGDGGSQILGFSAGVLAVVLTQDETTPLSSALPLLLLGIPIIDTLMVMTQRLLERRSPFSADRNHIHHRLLALGFDHHEAVMAIYVLQGSLFVAAWFLRYESDLTILSAFCMTAIVTVGTLQLASRTGWRWRPAELPSAAAHSAIGQAVVWLRRPEHLPRWTRATMAVAVTAYLLAVAAVCPGPSLDLRVMAVVLASGIAVMLVIKWRAIQAGWIAKPLLYLALVMAVYFDREVTTVIESHPAWQIALFAALVIAIGLHVRLAGEQRFRITPLDILVIFVALVVPNLPGAVTSYMPVGLSIAKLIALMYGIETLSETAAGWWRVPSLAALVFLATCALRGF